MQHQAVPKQQATFPDPPAHLSPRSKELWRELGPAEAKTIQRRALFQSALEALDRADQARQLIEAEGMVSKTTTTGALHIHPATKLEREARAQFAKIWGMLRLTWNS